MFTFRSRSKLWRVGLFTPCASGVELARFQVRVLGLLPNPSMGIACFPNTHPHCSFVGNAPMLWTLRSWTNPCVCVCVLPPWPIHPSNWRLSQQPERPTVPNPQLRKNINTRSDTSVCFYVSWEIDICDAWVLHNFIPKPHQQNVACLLHV